MQADGINGAHSVSLANVWRLLPLKLSPLVIIYVVFGFGAFSEKAKENGKTASKRRLTVIFVILTKNEKFCVESFFFRFKFIFSLNWFNERTHKLTIKQLDLFSKDFLRSQIKSITINFNFKKTSTSVSHTYCIGLLFIFIHIGILNNRKINFL